MSEPATWVVKSLLIRMFWWNESSAASIWIPQELLCVVTVENVVYGVC